MKAIITGLASLALAGALIGCNSIAKSRITTTKTSFIDGTSIVEVKSESYGRAPFFPDTPPIAETSITNSLAQGSSRQNNEGVRQQFKAAKPYHYMGIACVLLGAFCIWKRWTSTLTGLGIIGLGGAFSATAFYLPQHEGKVFYGLIAVAVIGGVYVVWSHGKAQPTSASTTAKQ